MKNITEILTGLGIQIPEDKKADFDKEFAENYKTIADGRYARSQADCICQSYTLKSPVVSHF